MMTKAAVYDVVRRIPVGRVMSYGGVARAVGCPRAARAVGRLLHQNATPFDPPCHRVVFADGRLSPAFVFGGENQQRLWLEQEGVTFLGDHVNMPLHEICFE